MNRKEEAVKEVESDWFGRNKKSVERTHPRFAVATMHRVNGNAQLFGSMLTDHFGYVVLEVRTAKEIVNDTGESTFTSIGGENVVQIHLSNAQFAELITNMNNASGVPVTMSVRDGKLLPSFPREDRSISRKAGHVVERKVEDVKKKILELSGKVNQVVEASGISKTKGKLIQDEVGTVVQEMLNSLPYIATTIDESIRNSASAAKIEVGALFARASSLASATLKIGEKAPEHLQIEEHTSDEEWFLQTHSPVVSEDEDDELHKEVMGSFPQSDEDEDG